MYKRQDNVIPSYAEATFNIRFNNKHSSVSIKISPVTFDFFLKPAVSKSSILSFLKTIDLEMASLVVPALGETIERFSLIKELKFRHLHS